MRKYDVLILHEDELDKTCGRREIWKSSNIFVEKADGSIIPYKQRWKMPDGVPNPKITLHLPSNPSLELDIDF